VDGTHDLIIDLFMKRRGLMWLTDCKFDFDSFFNFIKTDYIRTYFYYCSIWFFFGWYLLILVFLINVEENNRWRKISSKILGPIMKNLSTFGLLIGPKSLLVWGPMGSCVKPLRSYGFNLFFLYHFPSHLCFLFQTKP